MPSPRRAAPRRPAFRPRDPRPDHQRPSRQHGLRRRGVPRVLRPRAHLRGDHGLQARALRARAGRAQRAGRRPRRPGAGGGGRRSPRTGGGRAAMSEIVALGISHKTAPVEVRERVALGEREAERLLRELTAHPGVQEAVAISTCNRTEFYLVTTDPVQAEADLLASLATRAGIRPTELAGIVYTPRNCDAARQLYRVASGLESMIIGEAEVQGQVRRAYEIALAAGTTGPLTSRLFRAALEAGKRVRTQTLIGRERVSVSTVAVELAREVVGDLAARSVVVVGAGETSERTARALAAQGVTTIFVANRHADRARTLAERFGGTVGALDELPARLEEADIVVASTSSPYPIITAEELELVMRARDGRRLMLIDIAVPRDI